LSSRLGLGTSFYFTVLIPCFALISANSRSFDHYFHGTQPDNAAAGSDLGQGAMTDTIAQLTEFKAKCLKCCQ
jgi:hypothetical protein